MLDSQKWIKAICEQRRLPIYILERQLHFSNGYLMQDRSKEFPYDKLLKLANYFGVPVDAISDLYKTDSVPTDLSVDEWAIISLYRAADDHDKATIRQILSRYKGDSDAV